MKEAGLIIFFSIYLLPVYCQQFYIRGEVKDELGNNPIQNVNILLHSTGYVYHSGTTGAFGILTNKQIDSISFSMEGYQTLVVLSDANIYIKVKLKLLPINISTLRRDRLSSAIKHLAKEMQREWLTGDESYASIIENRFVAANKYPSTSVSLHVDKASYSNIRRFISTSSIVPTDAVRIEEMLNYFNNNYKLPAPDKLFSINSIATNCPWNENNWLFYINISSQKVNLDSLPPANLVFLIDVSGSMAMPNRLPLLQSAFRLLVNNLRNKDTVSIVIYGGTVGVILNATSGREKEKILKAIDELKPGGSTPGESGIRMAYRLARLHFLKNGNNRVILATDGDFNVGIQKEEDLGEMISKHRLSGVYLTCLGVGMGNYKDSKIQSLARKGNGNFAYIDSYQEAEKILMKEFSQTLYAVADDVLMDVEFNSDYVKEYRLIGFDNRLGALKNNVSPIEGGEVGSGQSIMAAFEIIPTKKSTEENLNREISNFANIKLQYRKPGKTTIENLLYVAPVKFKRLDDVDSAYRFSTAVIMFGSLLRQSVVAKNISWNNIIEIATGAANKNNFIQSEFIYMLHRAKNIYSKQKRKRNNRNYVD